MTLISLRHWLCKKGACERSASLAALFLSPRPWVPSSVMGGNPSFGMPWMSIEDITVNETSDRKARMHGLIETELDELSSEPGRSGDEG